MEDFWILIIVSLFATNLLDKAKSVKVKLEETPLKTFDEIFGEGWWAKDEAEDLKTPPTNFRQNVHHQIDRQNTQLRQIEPNSTDQNPPLTKSDHSGQIEPNSTDQNPPLTESDHSGQIEPNSTDQNPPLTGPDHSGQIEPNSTDQNPPLTGPDHSGQIEPNSTDQNPPLTESDHFGQIEPNSTDQSENIAEDERKLNIIEKFHAIKEELKQKGKFPCKERTQIENEIAKHLKVNRSKIYKWKKEFGQIVSQKVFYETEERKHLVEKFNQMKAELKRAGFKNSHQNEINETVAKELGLSLKTIYTWKQKLGQTKPQHKHSHSEQKEFLMKSYYEFKDKTPKMSDKEIAKILKIGTATLVRWKKQFKPQQFYPNSIDGHFVEENAAANVQEIGNSNLGRI